MILAKIWTFTALYITFLVNVAWHTLEKLGNGLMEHSKWGETKYIDQQNYYANRKMKEAI